MYIDEAYYSDTFQGAAADANMLAALISRACDMVDIITRYSIPSAGGIDTFPQVTIDMIKKATAYQTEYYVQNGGLETANSGQGVASDSVSIGKFSIKQRVTSKQQESDPRICPMTVSILEQTGLMSHSVGVVGGEFTGLGGWPIW